MKTKVLVFASTGFLLTAAALVLVPSTKSAPEAKDAHVVSRPVRHISSAPKDHSVETRNATASRQRLEAPQEMSDELEDAVDALLAKVPSTYHEQVQAGITKLAEMPPTERDEELAEIGRSVSDSMDVALESLGIDESRRASATAAAADTIIAEIKYAAQAPDPASRLSMLWLDREREVRASEALAIADPTLQSQSLSQLEAWYEEGVGGILAEVDSNGSGQVDATSSERR